MKNIVCLIGILICILVPGIGIGQGWQWAKTSTNWSTTEGVDVMGPTVIDENKDVFVAMTNLTDSIGFSGHTVYNTGLYAQTVIVKYDSAGNFIWAIATQNNNAWVLQLAIDNNNDLLVYGYKAGSITLGGYAISSSDQGFLTKISTAGSVIWNEDIDLSSSTGFLYGGLATDATGNSYITGTFETPTITFGSTSLTNSDPTGNSNDIFVVKYNAAGTPVWAKSIDGPENDESYCVAAGSNHDIFLSGRAQSDTLTFTGIKLYGGSPDSENNFKNRMTYIARYDSSGNVLWAKNLDQHLFTNGLATDEYGSVYFTGGYDSNIVVGINSYTLGYIAPAGFVNYGIIITKMDSSGNIVWSRTGGTNGYGQGWTLSVDHCGFLWACGSVNVSDTVNFDGHSFVTGDQSSNPDPLFIIEYDLVGDYQNGMVLPTGGDDICGIVTDDKGNFFIGGDYLTGTPTIGFGPDTIYNSPGTETENFYLLKYKYETTLCAAELAVGENVGTDHIILLYPNPASTSFQLRSDIDFKSGSYVIIYDIAGRALETIALSGNEATVVVCNFPAGVYQCVVHVPGEAIEVKPFIVQP